MKVMILAAGYGKRLLPLTKETPKPLLKIGDKTLIQLNIEHLIKNDFTEFVINISHLGHMIENHVKEKFSNINIEFSKEDKPLGTGGGILNAIDLLGDENFLVMNSDIFHKIDIKNLPKKIDAAHLIGVPNPSHNQEGDFCIKDNKVAIDEFNDLTWSGISIINPIIFKEKNFRSGSFNIWDTVLPNYLNNGNVSAHKSNDLWIDVGTHERLKLANSLYNDQN
jgi:MurNAc alpha-1-phosphate uridylyltransferase